MRAAIRAIRKSRPDEIVVALPVGAPPPLRTLPRMADEVVCPAAPEDFGAIRDFYEDFTPVTDEEILGLREQASQRTPLNPGNQS